MDKFLNYSVIGLTTAAIYAIAASGLVVTYTTSGIFNFAHGAFGMLAAFLFWQLHFDWGWPTPIALLVVPPSTRAEAARGAMDAAATGPGIVQATDILTAQDAPGTPVRLQGHGEAPGTP